MARPSQTIEGTFQTIDATGRLILEQASGQVAIEAGVRFLPETHAHLASVCGPTRTLRFKCNGQETHARSRVVLGADGLGGRLLAGQADLVTAFRLPSSAFKANAGTEVTTDILFLRKREPGQQPSGESWRHLETIDSGQGPIEVNEYFARHPDMMLGQMRLKGTVKETP